MKTRTYPVGVGLSAAVAAAMWVSIGPTQASAGDAREPSGWQATQDGDAGTSVAQANDGAERLAFSAVLLRNRNVDTGSKGSSPGDYNVFEERLNASDGTRIGDDSATCLRTGHVYRCQGTFSIDGRGSVEVSGSLQLTGGSLAVTGGTGEFRTARGEARIVGSAGSSTNFVISLLP